MRAPVVAFLRDHFFSGLGSGLGAWRVFFLVFFLAGVGAGLGVVFCGCGCRVRRLDGRGVPFKAPLTWQFGGS